MLRPAHAEPVHSASQAGSKATCRRPCVAAPVSPPLCRRPCVAGPVSPALCRRPCVAGPVSPALCRRPPVTLHMTRNSANQNFWRGSSARIRITVCRPDADAPQRTYLCERTCANEPVRTNLCGPTCAVEPVSPPAPRFRRPGQEPQTGARAAARLRRIGLPNTPSTARVTPSASSPASAIMVR